MLANLIEACPEEQWTARDSGSPFWQQIMHALTGIQFWFREADEGFAAPDFGHGPIPDLDIVPVYSLTREQVREYRRIVAKRVDAFFSKMDDIRLMQTSRIYDECTCADIVIMQIRHIQHHVGSCNCLLRSNLAGTVGWLGYAEEGPQ